MDRIARQFSYLVIAGSHYTCPLTDPKACIPCQQVAQLLNEPGTGKKRQQQNLNVKHDNMDSCMPPEILSEIFKLCLPRLDKRFGLPEEKSNFAVAAPLVLSAVCQRWRIIAHSTQRLWENVFICLGPRSSGMIPILAQEWIQRSGQLPLSINVYVRQGIDKEQFWKVFEVIQRCSSTWRLRQLQFETATSRTFLQFSCDPECIHRLQTLYLQRNGTSKDTTWLVLPGDLVSKPKRLELVGISPNNVAFDPSRLTDLKIYDGQVGVYDCLKIIQQASNLEHCLICIRSHVLSHTRPPIRPIMHRKILGLILVNNHSSPILEHLICPSLVMLRITDFRLYAATDTIIDFIERSECSLATLSIQRMLFMPEDIELLFRSVPTIRYLHLNMFWISQLDENFFALLSRTSGDAPMYLPALRILEIEQNDCLDLTSLPGIFNTPHRIRELRSIEMTFGGSGKVRPDLREKIEALQKQGLRLRVIGKDSSRRQSGEPA